MSYEVYDRKFEEESLPTGGYFVYVVSTLRKQIGMRRGGGYEYETKVERDQLGGEKIKLQIKSDTFMKIHKRNPDINSDPFLFIGFSLESFIPTTDIFLEYDNGGGNETEIVLRLKNLYIDQSASVEQIKYIFLILYIIANGIPTELNDNFVNERNKLTENKTKIPSMEDVYKMYTKYIKVDKWKLKTAFEYNKSNPSAVKVVETIKSLTSPSETSFTYFDPNGTQPKSTTTVDTTTTSTSEKTTDTTLPTQQETKGKGMIFYFVVLFIFLVLVLIVLSALGIIH